MGGGGGGSVVVVALLFTVMQGVFSKSWDVTLPQRIVSVRGSCVTIPCHFDVPITFESNVLNCSGRTVWSIGSVHSKMKVQGKLIGDLTRKNCTTTMNSLSSNVYFFRLECPDLKFTFDKGVNISIESELPPPPRLSAVSLAPEGGIAKLKCETPVSCSVLPPSLNWSLPYASSQEESHVQQSPDGSMTLTSMLTFNASADHHNRTVWCSVSYPLLGGGSSPPAMTGQRLSIQYAPRLTTATISPSGPVFEGETVTLTCSSDANPPVRRYIWFREEGWKLRAIASQQTLEWPVSVSHSGRYLCEAQSPRGSERSSAVFLQVTSPQAGDAGGGGVALMMHHIISGVLSVLYILLVVFTLYKWQSLSGRLKKIEQKGEHTYMDLKTFQVSSDYDQLQLKPNPRPPAEDPLYENSTTQSEIILGPANPERPI